MGNVHPIEPSTVNDGVVTAAAASRETGLRGGRRPLWIVVGLYLIAFGMVAGYGLVAGYRSTPRALDADEFEYWTMAGGLFHGDLVLTSRRTLGFPLMLAAIRAVRDDIVLVQLVTSAVYALTPPLLFLLIRRLYPSTAAAALAGLALALWPPAIFFGASLYSEVLAAPVFVSVLLMLPTPSQRRWIGCTFVAGMLLGLATHVRPMYLLFLPGLCLILLVEQRRAFPAAIRFLTALAGFAIVILPWSAVITHRVGHVVLVSENGGETLAGGLNPALLQPIPTSVALTPSGRLAWVGPGKWLPPSRTGYLTPAEQRLSYHQHDILLRQRARAWIMAHPLEAMDLEACKLAYMWGLYGIADNSMVQRLLGNLPTVALLLLAAWALHALAGDRARYVRLWILPLFVSCIALISWGSWRFRQPGDIGLIGLCAIAIVQRTKRNGRDAVYSRDDGAGNAR